MKKIKTLLFSLVALFVFTLVMVKVDAAVHDIGKYKVSTTTAANDTATWDFNYDGLPQKKDFANGDVLAGGIVLSDTRVAGGGSKWVEVKPGAGLDLYTGYKSGETTNPVGGTVYVPIPDEAEGGTITVTTQGDQSSRKLYINDDKTKAMASSTGGASYTFTLEDCLPYNGSGNYLKLSAYDESTITKQTEVKIFEIKVVLSSGAYEATAQLFNVTYHDGASVIKTEEVTSGSPISYTPAKWGYTFDGLYTDAALTTPYAVTTPVTAALDLYTKWTPWAAGTITDPNTLDLALMAKGLDVFGANLTGNVALTGTNYTLLGGATVFQGSAKTVGDFAEKSVAAIKTGGTLAADKNGLMLTTESAGVLTIYARWGGTGKEYSLNVLGANDLNLVSTEKTLDTMTTAFTFNLPAAGDYSIGSKEGSVLLYYVSFKAEAAPVQPVVNFYQQTGYNDEGAELVRYIAIVENIDEADLEGFNLTLTGEGLNLDITDNCKVAKRLVNKGETYKAMINDAEYTFDEKDNVLYVVCVVAVSNNGNLHEEYKGKTITATLLTPNGQSIVKTYVVQGAKVVA